MPGATLLPERRGLTKHRPEQEEKSCSGFFAGGGRRCLAGVGSPGTYRNVFSWPPTGMMPVPGPAQVRSRGVSQCGVSKRRKFGRGSKDRRLFVFAGPCLFFVKIVNKTNRFFLRSACFPQGKAAGNAGRQRENCVFKLTLNFNFFIAQKNFDEYNFCPAAKR